MKPFTVNHTRLAADYSAAVRASVSDAELLRADIGSLIDNNECIEAALNAQGHSLLDGNQLSIDAGNRAMAKSATHGYQLRRVLVGCEFSGIVRDEISAYGHDVTSLDILPTEKPGRHIIGDLREYMNDGYTDLLSFPPCTYLCASGAKHRKGNFGRWRLASEALQFVRDIMSAKVERQCLENSVGLITHRIRKWDQIVQPYEYGDDASKRTCLWLDGLPLLTKDEADYVEPRVVMANGGKLAKRWGNQCDGSGADRTSPGPDRWAIRSRTHKGIAAAMASQWFNTERVAA